MEFKSKSSIRIYSYKREIQHEHKTIIEKIENVDEHKYALRHKQTDGQKRYVRFSFKKIDSLDKNLLSYNITAMRELPDTSMQYTDHDICFSKKGYLILTGMTHRITLLKYLTQLLHPKQQSFEPRQLSKNEIQTFTDSLLIKNINRIYRPRFHFLDLYRNREFNDYVVSFNECATEDAEYSKMMKKCMYFEPIFKINKLNDADFVTNLKLNNKGHIYSSAGMKIDEWVIFIKNHIGWCV